MYLARVCTCRIRSSSSSWMSRETCSRGSFAGMHLELRGRGGRCSGGMSGELSPVIISKLPLSKLLPTEEMRGFEGEAGVLPRQRWMNTIVKSCSYIHQTYLDRKTHIHANAYWYAKTKSHLDTDSLSTSSGSKVSSSSLVAAGSCSFSWLLWTLERLPVKEWRITSSWISDMVERRTSPLPADSSLQMQCFQESHEFTAHQRYHMQH